MSKFVVDTHLFRELGTHLVGRDSTALVELIKNAYDADANTVVVDGQGLNEPGGRITITDDGNGMTPESFSAGFLTIASRSKDTSERRSPRFGRRFTGAKGIGRLAAHKLCSSLTVRSDPRSDAFPSVKRLRGVDATIDWDEIERHPTLDDVGEGLRVSELPSNAEYGTTLTLSPMRAPFEGEDLMRFVTEVTTFEPPPVLVRPLPDTIVAEPVLFAVPEVRESRKADRFALSFTGDLSGAEDFWQLVGERTHWVLEIRAAPRSRMVEYVIAPTRAGLKRNKYAERREFSGSHPSPGRGPAFFARILVSETGRFGRDSASTFAKENTGVRVYMEGFRVLPYGERTDDWLGLDTDYTRRREAFDLSDIEGSQDPVDNEAFFKLTNKNFFGGVFLREASAGGLEMLINREGFLPNGDLETLRRLMRQGVDLVARVRAGAEQRKGAGERHPKPNNDRGKGRGSQGTNGSPPVTPIGKLQESIERISSAAADFPAAAQGDPTLTKAVDSARSALKGLRDDQAVFRTLATLGTQFSSFVHETNLLLNQARYVRRLVGDSSGANEALVEAAEELVQTLERQASFLADLIGATARRSRRPLDPRERLDSALRLVGGQLERRRIELLVDIPDGSKTPAMFPMELTAIYANLLSNAIKAAGEDGRIRVATMVRRGLGGTVLRVENTGTAVDLSTSEQWFLPFESTTTEIDETLGVGLGLGLPIVRRLVEDYGGEAAFVPPGEGYATAIEVRIPHGSLSQA